MTPLAILLSWSLSHGVAPVLVAVTTEGLPDRDRDAVVAFIVGEVQSTGVTPVPLPPGVVTQACAADPACARNFFSGGGAARLVFVDVLRAGSRASISARVLDREGRTVAEHAAVLPMVRLVAGQEAVLPGSLLQTLAVSEQPPTTTPGPTTPTTTSVTTPTPTTPATTPGETDPSLDPGTISIIGVGVGAVGALFLIGGTAAALGQNAVRLDASADGDDRAATALTIPMALGVAALGAVGVGVGVVMLMGDDGGDAPAVPAGG